MSVVNYVQREVWSCIQSVLVSLMTFSLEGSYHCSSQDGLQYFILGGLNGRRTAEGRMEGDEGEEVQIKDSKRERANCNGMAVSPW